MTRFDERWRRLTAAARRAPVPEVAPLAARAWLQPRSEVDAPWPWRLRALAAAWVLAGVFAIPSLGRALTAPAGLAPTLPSLPRLPPLPPIPPLPALDVPAPPSLPDVGAIVRTLEEDVP